MEVKEMKNCIEWAIRKSNKLKKKLIGIRKEKEREKGFFIFQILNFDYRRRPFTGQLSKEM